MLRLAARSLRCGAGRKKPTTRPAVWQENVGFPESARRRLREKAAAEGPTDESACHRNPAGTPMFSPTSAKAASPRGSLRARAGSRASASRATASPTTWTTILASGPSCRKRSAPPVVTRRLRRSRRRGWKARPFPRARGPWGRWWPRGSGRGERREADDRVVGRPAAAEAEHGLMNSNSYGNVGGICQKRY